MRLTELFAAAADEDLQRFVLDHGLGDDAGPSRAAMCAALEGEFRSCSSVRKALYDRLPPTFSILETLLDAPGFSHPAASLRETVEQHSARLKERIESGDLLGQGEHLELYRRVLREARRNDLVLDASESALLAVLRRELDLKPVDHFLLEHHEDFSDLWSQEYIYLQEMTAMRASGLLFVHGDNVVLPEELAPRVRHVLGLEMSTDARGRLYSLLHGTQLSSCLGAMGAKASGTNEEKRARLLGSYAPPSNVVKELRLEELRVLCTQINAPKSGGVEELRERLVDWFLHARDLTPQAASSEPVEPEPERRVLTEQQFQQLFFLLKSYELTEVLDSIKSARMTGTKESKIAQLWASPRSENTLLSTFGRGMLQDILTRLGLRTSGNKAERIQRLLAHYCEPHGDRDATVTPIIM